MVLFYMARKKDILLCSQYTMKSIDKARSAFFMLTLSANKKTN